MTDRFRKKYHKLNEINAQLINDIKETAEIMEQLMSSLQTREMALALTNLEQCTMWATKAIVLHDERTMADIS